LATAVDFAAGYHSRGGKNPTAAAATHDEALIRRRKKEGTNEQINRFFPMTPCSIDYMQETIDADLFSIFLFCDRDFV
jgi:hypothetical protein